MNVYDTNVRLTWYVESGLEAAGARYEHNLIKFTSRVANKVTDYVDAQPR